MARTTTTRRSAAPPRRATAMRPAPARRTPGMGPGGLGLATTAAPVPGMMSLPGTAPQMARTAPPAPAVEPAVAPAPPTAETAPPVAEAARPLAETAPPVAETAPPVAETAPPVAETAPPVEEAARPVEEAAPPVAEAEQPVAEAEQPASEAGQPAEMSPAAEAAVGPDAEQALAGGGTVEAGAGSEAPAAADDAVAEAGAAVSAAKGPAEEVASGGGPEAVEEPAIPAGPSPEEAVAPAAAAVGSRAGAASAHQPAEAASEAAIEASNEPAVTHARGAEQAAITATDETETGEVDVAAFQDELKNALQNAVPPPRSEAEAERQVERGPVDAAAPLQTALGEQSTAAVGDLPATAAAEPDPSQQPAFEAAELQPEEAGAPPAPVSAAPVVPPPLPDAVLDTSQNEAQVDQLAAENDITEAQLQGGNDPQFAAALGTRSEAEAHDEAAPAAYREQETAARQDVRGRAAGRIGGSLAEIQTTRVEELGAVAQTQGDTERVTAERKAEITLKIKEIGRATRDEVTTILTDMQTEAARMFNETIGSAQIAFNAIMDEEVGGGWFSSLISSWFDSSDEYDAALADATKTYDEIINGGINEVAAYVVKELQRAKDRVAEGREEIDDYVNETLTEDERQFGEDASAAITADFDALEGEIEESRSAVVGAMVDIYRAGIEARNAAAEEYRERSKSIWQRAYDATVGVVRKVIEFKNLLLGILASAASVVESIIQDPIGFLKNLIAGIGAGLQRFVENIGENLKQALMGWLFGALEGAGIKLPAQFDLKGFLDVIMQVLGLTKENVRARAVKILGEETVAKIEGAVDFLRILFTEGPAGIWEMLLQQLGNLKDAIIEEIKSWVITKIVIAGIKWIVSLLNPASAFVKACMMIYDIIMFFMERGQQIISVVQTVVGALATIVAGNIGAMAKAVEGALNRILPVVIGFLASLLGLGGISAQIRKVIEAIQAPVNKAIDWVIHKGVSLAKKIGGLFGGKKEDKKTPEATDPETQAQIDAGLMTLRQKDAAIQENAALSREEAESVAVATRTKHPVFQSIEVVSRGERWGYQWKANPKDTEEGGEQEEGEGPEVSEGDTIVLLNLKSYTIPVTITSVNPGESISYRGGPGRSHSTDTYYTYIAGTVPWDRYETTWREVRSDADLHIELHHKIPHTKQAHWNHPLRKLAETDLSGDPRNLMRLGGHRGFHAASYHTAVQAMMMTAFNNLTNKDQASADAAMGRIMQEIETKISNQQLNPYEDREVWIP